MAKLYFKYGAMGSSKSAQALITQFNYEELGMTVWLIKPSVDDRDGADIIRSRIGLERRAQVIRPEDSIRAEYAKTTEIKTVCACGSKATVNARIDENGRVVTEGGQILIGGNDRYVAMCHRCWKKRIREQQA